MKNAVISLVAPLLVLTCGCAPRSSTSTVIPAIHPFEIHVAQKNTKDYYTVASLNIVGEDVQVLADELVKSGINAPIESGLLCEIWADAATHPKVIRFLSSHPIFREKVLSYYALPKEY
jgi:hypothetical protein